MLISEFVLMETHPDLFCGGSSSGTTKIKTAETKLWFTTFVPAAKLIIFSALSK